MPEPDEPDEPDEAVVAIEGLLGVSADDIGLALAGFGVVDARLEQVWREAQQRFRSAVEGAALARSGAPLWQFLEQGVRPPTRQCTVCGTWSLVWCDRAVCGTHATSDERARNRLYHARWDEQHPRR